MIEIILIGMLLLSVFALLAGVAISRRVKAREQVVAGVKRRL